MNTKELTATQIAMARGMTIAQALEGLEKRVAEQEIMVTRFGDALEHITHVCQGSRQRTRRIRWIELRADCALKNTEDWKTVDLPRHEPEAAKLCGMIASVYDIVKREIEALKDVYTDNATGEITDEQAKADLKLLERFVRDAFHHVESIRHYEENQRATADGNR